MDGLNQTMESERWHDTYFYYFLYFFTKTKTFFPFNKYVDIPVQYISTVLIYTTISCIVEMFGDADFCFAWTNIRLFSKT